MSAKAPDFGASYFNFVIGEQKLKREKYIAEAEFQLLHDEFAECNRVYGIHSHVMCRELRDKYLVLKDDRLRGMLLPEGVEVDRRNGIFTKSENPRSVV